MRPRPAAGVALYALLVLLPCACDSKSLFGQDGGQSDLTGAPDRRIVVDAPVIDAPVTDGPTAPDRPPLFGDAGIGVACDPQASVCAGDLLCCRPCCTSTAQAVCTAPVSGSSGPSCPLPDLTIDTDALGDDISIDYQSFAADGCSIMEGCIQAAGLRRVLRFSVVTPNNGTADLYLGNPSGNPLFQYSSCHNHYHFSGYARYRLLDMQGNPIGTGRKQAFCLLDYDRLPSPPPGTPVNEQYDCSNQGISRGWSDVYSSNLPCQFVDITGVPEGTYTLEVAINPDQILAESRYDNNVGTVQVMIPAPPPPPDPLDSCSGTRQGIERECGWTSGGTFTCTPGGTVQLGCGGTQCAQTSCTGDPMLRVCDGSAACNAPGLGQNDDCSESVKCSSISFLCPASGQYTVLTAPYDTRNTATCTIQHSP